MSRLGINTGSNPNDGQGDPLRVAMGKINSNFLEVYNTFGNGFTLASYVTTAGVATVAQNLTGSPRINVSGILNTGITTTEHIQVVNVTSTGVVTATQFVGDGSQLTNVTSTASGVSIYDDNVFLGVARELNFDANIVSTSPDGTQRVKISASGYATTAGIATYASTAGVATYASIAGVATVAGYATTAGIATVAQGLTGSPNITVGVITATTLRGSGVNITGIVTSIVAGTGVSVSSSTGQVTINATGGGSSGIIVRDDGTLIGTASSINFGANLSVSPLSAGIVTVTGAAGGGGIAGIDTTGTSFFNQINATGVITASSFVGNLTGTATTSSIATVAQGLTGTPNIIVGVVTANKFESISAGTPTIGAATTISLETITVAISTDATIGRKLTVSGINTLGSGGINVTGIITATAFIGDGSGLTNLPGGGISTYATTAGVSTYATTAGIATFATTAGTATTSTTVDILNTNGLTTVYYPTFVESRANGQILRGDVDLTYRTDTNTLTATNVNATSFVGSGSSLTGLTGASANTYGNGTAVPQIVVDSNGRITSITNVAINTSGVGGGGTSGIYVNDETLVGFAGTINFGDGLSVTPLSAGIVTANVTYAPIAGYSTSSGVSTTSGYSTSSGVSTTAGYATTAGIATVSQGLSGTPNITVGSIISNNINSSGIVTGSRLVSTIATGTAPFTVTSTTQVSNLNVSQLEGAVSSTSSVSNTIARRDGSSNLAANAFIGSGTNLTGIVTSIVAGTNVSISTSTGQVTINATGGGGSSQWSTVSSGIVTTSNVGIATTNPTRPFQVGSGSTIVYVDDQGDLGIGTDTATSKLHVVGNAIISGVVTATSFQSVASGTPTIGAATTISLETIRVAISTDLTVGRNINISGITTSTSFRANSTIGDGSDVGFAIKYYITSNGSSGYRFAGPGIVNTVDNPTLYLHRGFTYIFENSTGGSHPFAIRYSSGGTGYGSTYLSGSQTGTQIFTIPFDAPSSLVYQCTIHSGMLGTLTIVS